MTDRHDLPDEYAHEECKGCGAMGSTCNAEHWLQGMKCCPDCSHRPVAPLKQVLSCLVSIARSLEVLSFQVANITPAIEELRSPKKKTTKRKRRRKRKPRGIAASLVSLVLLVGCGGVASRTESFEGGPVPLAEGGPVRVAQRDASDGGHAIECTPDAEAHTGILCMHPKRQRGADGAAHP